MKPRLDSHWPALFGTSLAMGLAPNSGQAQEVTPAQSGESIEEVIVTGFRGSIDAALDEKRDSAGVVDVIKAEDIADFPDSNLAESLQRVPGVSISRVGGEGRNITVRGLGPTFTRVRINGMEAQSAAGGTTSDRGANTERGFDFNVFASELFNSLAVRKTSSAEVVEGSLGATVDLTTARPFDYQGFTFVTNVQEGYNTLAEDSPFDEFNPRLSAVISNTWMDGRFGALASVAYSERKYREEVFGSGGWNPATVDSGFCTPVDRTPATPDPSVYAATGADADHCATGVVRPAADDTYYDLVNQSTVFLPRLPRYGRYQHDQKRLGMTGALQWQPSDATLLNLDVLYSDYDVSREESWLEGFSFARSMSQYGKPQTAIRYAELRPAGISHTQGANYGQQVYDIAYGVFDGVDVRSDTQHDEWESKFLQFTLSGKQDLSDTLVLTAMAGYSKNRFAQPHTTTIMFQRPNAGLSVDFRDDRDRPSITHDFDVTDATLYTFGPSNAEVRLNPLWTDNESRSGELNLAWTASPELTTRLGLRYTDYQFDTWAKARANNFDVPTLSSDALAQVTRPVTGFGKHGLGGRFPASWATIDYDKFVDSYNIYSDPMYALQGPLENSTARGNTRGIEEQDTAAYLQADFTIDTLPWLLRGDAGLRYVHTDLSAYGYRVATDTEQVQAGNTYDDWLPSVNLVAEVTPEVLLRASSGRVMVRPGTAALNPGGTLALNGTPNMAAGNPDLDPIRAWTYDLSAEWYFSRSSLIALGLFYKDIDSYIQQRATTTTYRETGLPLELLEGTNVDPDNTPFVVTEPVNTPGGPLKGFEVNYQQAFSFLPGWMHNFGLLLNYTWVDSRITYFLASDPGNTTRNDLLGLSKNAWNATLYWENDTYSARISGAYRDKYIDALPANNPLQDLEGTDEYLQFDMSLAWTINEQFKLTLEGINIFDEFKRQYIDSDRNSTWVYGHTGADFNLGLQYKF